MGYKLAGFEHLGGVEIDEKVAEIYRLNHKPKHLFIEDIRKFNMIDLDFNIPTFDPDAFGAATVADATKTRHIRPAKHKAIPESRVLYRNAEKLAADLPALPGMWHICIVDGSFIAGDFIEAFIKKNNLHAKRISISTLSLNQENVDSLGNLLFDGWADELDMIVSDGFWQNYRRDIIPYIYAELDTDNRFQLAVARVHTKVTLIETHCGLKITMRGSANLRSSNSIEHLEIQEGAEIFDFFQNFHDGIIEKFKTINKDAKSNFRKRSLSRPEAWQAAI